MAQPGSLADRLEASDWSVALRGVHPDTAQEAVESLLAQERAEVTRTFKTGPRTFDARGAVLSMRVVDRDDLASVAPQALPGGEEPCAIIRVVVRHTTPAVRPDDILTALRAVAGLVPPSPPLVTRLAQGPLRDADVAVADPLAADEKAGGS